MSKFRQWINSPWGEGALAARVMIGIGTVLIVGWLIALVVWGFGVAPLLTLLLLVVAAVLAFVIAVFAMA